MKKNTMASVAVFAMMASGLAMSAASFAKNGFASAQEQSAITHGMTQEQVKDMLGTPTRVKTYAIDKDSTWVYRASLPDQFLIHFSPEGKVVSQQLMGREQNR